MSVIILGVIASSPMPLVDVVLALLGVVDNAGESCTGAGGSSGLIVEVEVDRMKPLVRGARWVSFSSASLLAHS